MGQLGSNGLIGWQPEQVVLSPSSATKFPNDVIGVDSNGQIWVGYQQDNSGTRTPHIIHSNSTLPPQPLSTGFVVNASDPTVLQTVMFNATATGGNWGGISNYAFSWNFGDGATATGQSVTHQYTSFGNYTVTLITTDSGNPQQTASSAQTVPVVLPLLPSNLPPTLQVPASRSVKTGTPVSFTITTFDNDGDTVTLSSSSLPVGASFNPGTGLFTWTPTPDQSNQFWPISFTATDNATLSVMKQVLIYVSPAWSGDFLLSTSVNNGNWHVDIATLATSGQVYAAYWVEGNPLYGRLYDNLAWGTQENVWGPSSPPSTDVNSFIFATGSGVSAIYYDTNVGKLYSSSRGTFGGWGSNVISPGDAKSAGTLGRYSLPFTAAYDQGDSRFYVFWYNQANSTIDEFSGSDTTWLKTEGAFSTHSSAAGSTIGSYHYSTSVSGKNAFGIMWIDGTGPSYNLNFGLETVGPLSSPTTDSSWNPRVSCTASVVTIEQILGNQNNSFGGATESGSIFNPGILAKSPGDAKRWLAPPCTITNADGQGVSTFVEIVGVQRGFLLNEDYSVHFDPVNGGGPYPNGMNTSDTTFNIFTPGYNDASGHGCSNINATGCMHTIHLEFDHDWKAAGYCGPNTVCDPYQMAAQSAVGKTLLDVQGFIYWDPEHADDASHGYSGWELHPLAGWRLHGVSSFFTLSANPAKLTIIPGGSSKSNITINASNVWQSFPLSMTAKVFPAGPTLTMTPATATVPSCNQCSIAFSILNITTTQADSGTYIVTVTGGTGAAARSVNLTALVEGFTISASPASLSIQAGSTSASIITLTSVSGFSGTVNLASAVSGCGCFTSKLNSTSVVVSSGGTKTVALTVNATSTTGNEVITVTGTAPSISFSASTTISVTSVDFAANAAKSVLTLNAGFSNSTSITLGSVNGFSGTVALTATSNSTNLSSSLSAPSVTLQASGPGSTASVVLTVNGTKTGNYLVTITATSGSLTHKITITVKVVDFSIASAASIQVNVGSSGSTTITLGSLNGFAGTIALTNSTSPSGIIASLSSRSVLLSSNGSNSVILTVFSTTVTNYNLTITGTSGTLVHTIHVTVNFVDFTIAASSVAPASINAGSPGISTISVTGLNGFAETVALSFTTPSGITCSLSATRISLPPSPATSVLSCSSSIAANYSVTVTGTNGTLAHTTALILFRIVDFTIVPLPSSSVSLVVGQSSTTTSIHLGSLNGFTGTVTLNVLISPVGPSASLTPANLKLSPSGCACNSSVLNINAGQVAGVYTLNITATNGSLTHFAIITLTVIQDTPSLTTKLSASSIIAGSSVTDSATLSGATSTASGSVTYYLFTNGACTAPSTIVSTVAVFNDVVPSSRPVVFNATGSYSFNATYSGDNNNGAAASACEPLAVQKDSPTIITSLASASIQVGQSVTDSATLSNVFQATGTMSYSLFVGSSTCAGTGFTVSIVAVTNGVVPNSRSVTFNSTNPGGYSFQVSYSGDANNNIATSPCEPLNVQKASPVIATALSSQSIIVGTNDNDSATLTGGFNPGGTVTYSVFSNNACTAPGIVVSTVTLSANSVPNSRPVIFNATGTYSFQAVYSGDANNNGASSGCESLAVNKTSPTMTTSLSSTGPIVGTTVSDSATLASFFQAGGTVTYSVYPNGGCTAPGKSASAVSVTNGVIPNSRAVLLNSTGSFSFNALYSGDSNNSAASSACEPLAVAKAAPAISTTLSSVTIIVGGFASDSASLTGSFNAGGSVTYFDFSNGVCTTLGTIVSTVAVTAGSVPNSRTVLFNSTGNYAFQASYSGDANNNATLSPCEPLQVGTVNVTITTILSSTGITVGQSVTDSATLHGATGNAAGTVTYQSFASGTCAGPASTVSVVAVTNGAVPNSRAVIYNSTGSFGFKATYSGDPNNGPAISVCEPLTVGKTSPSISTALSATTITVGTTASDSATMNGTYQASGTVTYEYFTGSTCAGTATIVGSPVTVTNGVVPNSASQQFISAGPYSWNASYSGDSNNNAVSSPCEPLAVTKANPTVATILSSSSPVVGTTVTDSGTLSSFFQAGGTVQYDVYPNGACTATFTIASVVTVVNGAVLNSRAVLFNSTGAFGFQAVYSGDANNNGANSACEPLTVQKASPTIATTLSSASIMVGTSASDSSTLTGSFSAGGIVTYSDFTNGACTALAKAVSTVTVTSGVVPDSRAVTFNATGSYSFHAVYSGDANNNGASSPCELLTVTKVSPTITTTLSSSSIVVGATVTDSATLTGSFSASGGVTYSVFTNGACTALGTGASTVTVTGGVVPNSRAVTFNGTGSFSFQAVYFGDTNNNGAISACEPLTVNQASSTITTSLSSTTPVVGTTVTDSSTLASFFQAGGTVQYNVYANSACTAPFTTVSTVTITNGAIPNSRAVLFNSTGAFAFQAVYSGDVNNNAATSVCEPLAVQKASPTITTTLSAITLTVGASVTDSSTMASFFQAGGTVTYNEFTGSTCTGTATVVSTVTVTNGVVPNSAAVTPTPAGAYRFNTVYSGDANNNAATSACDPLTVNKASPTITTTLSATTITVGISVTDSSTMVSFFQAGGTVTYNEFTGGTCAGTATAVSTVTVTNGVAPNSAAVTPTPLGSYSFDAVYSGDVNNNAATSACEPLTVNKASPTITTTLSATTVTVGTSVTDSSTMASFFQAGGPVTYNQFTGGTCAGTATVVSTVTVTNGVVPNSAPVTPSPAGSFSFNAVYSGDANNNAATSACEPLTVNKASPTITTTLSATTITVGTSVTDSSTMSSFFQAGGTVTYNRFSGSTCAGTATVVSTVTVTNGVVPNSAANTPTPAGAYSFNAVYSGDANNNAATSACEPLTVNKVSPTITTRLSSMTPVVGTTVTDSSTLASFFQAGGTVQYNVYTNGACTAPFSVASTVTVTSGVVPDSRAVTFNATGSYSFQAVYSGDSNNNGAMSSCEPLTVSKVNPAITAVLSSTLVTVGGSVSDSATLTGGFSAGGTVTYAFFAGSTCAGTATTVGSPVTVTDGVVPNSATQPFNSAGSFSWNAVYSGDSNNNGATSACEPLTVQKTNPTITINLSAPVITVGSSASDSATLNGAFQAVGTVTYEYFTGSNCGGASTTVGTPVAVTNSLIPNSSLQTFNSAGGFSWNAIYSGDSNNNGATSPCEPLTVNKASPTISTTLSPNQIQAGQSTTDSATLTNSYQAGGTLTYDVFTNSACIAPGTVVSTVTVTNGFVPNSRAVTFNATGPYSFQAVYGGDSNNNGGTSGCEPLTVNPITGVTISTTLSSNAPIVGSSVSDTAALSGAISASGTVTYTVFPNSACTPSGTVISVATVTNGVVPSSRAVIFNATGQYSFQATYSGDSNNNPATSTCELLTVQKATPSITTNLSAATVVVGNSVTDSSTLTSGYNASGSVVYEFFTGGTCLGTPTTVGSSAPVTSGSVPDSSSQTFNLAGAYSWNAIYTGDSNNNGVISPCEPLTVSKANPTISTTLASTAPIVGTGVSDSATLTNSFNAGGTVTYSLYANLGCTNPGVAVSTVAVTSGIVPDSRSVLFNSTGSYSFHAAYSGDQNNNPSISGCELLIVQKASPTIITTLSASTPIVGTGVTDSVSLTGGFQATGTVVYTIYSNGACTSTGKTVSTVSVTNGVVPDSRTVILNATGQYTFKASYSGDSNNIGASNDCEPLTVQKASPTITTQLTSVTPTVGTSISDSANLSGGYNAGGIVTYSVFTNGFCIPSGSIASTVAVVSNAVPNSRAVFFNATGTFSFQGVYSGDANNGGASSICEPLTVQKASPAIATQLSSTNIPVGGLASDTAVITNGYVAGGTVSYEFFTGSSCSGTATNVGTPVTVSNGVVPNSAFQAFNSAGPFSWNALYSGDSNNNAATSPCEPLTVNMANPTIATTLSSTNPVVGTSVSDSSSLTGSFSASGTVTYSIFTNNACTAPRGVVSTVTVISGSVPNSRPVEFNSTGGSSFQAVYSGDANNNGASSSCEPLNVQKASPSITTTLSSTSIQVGQSVTDSASLANSFQASGSVTYTLFANSGCTPSGTTVSTVTVSNGAVPNSRAVLFNNTGSYSFQSVYSGDLNNNGAISSCEALTVSPAGVTISTNLSTASIPVGGSITDSSTLQSETTTAGGTVTYDDFANGNCAGTGTAFSVAIVTNGVVPSSRSITFNNTGTFSLQAVYGGDANNNGAISSCEPLTVQKVSPTITTTLSATTITVGNTVTDSSTLIGSFSAGGTVTYSEFANGGCTASGTVVSIVTVAGGVVPNSRAVALNGTGSFSFQAVYSGDSNNSGATSPCEPLTVNKASPSIATTLSATTIIVGNSVSGSSTLSNFYKATGTATYEFFSGSACTGTVTSVGTPLTVTNGVVPDSGPQAFGSAGLFSWNAVYSGDANNGGATSPCEPLSVNKTNPTLATTLSSASITVGSSTTDSAVLSGTFQAGGTVTYSFFTNGACTAPGTVASIVTVTGGVIPNSRAVTFNATGSFSFQAVYPGDSNNNAATSPCEPLAVNKAGPTIGTTLSSTSIQVDQSVTDSANLTGFFQAGGTATYSVFTNGVCTAPGTAVSTVTVTNGVVPNSRSVLFNATGSYSFAASYSGDANNNGATSGCEPLIVGPVGVTITTTLSTTTITVGGSVSDSATLHSQRATAGGTVTYSSFGNGNCAAPGKLVSIVTVTNGVVPDSRAVTFNGTGSFSFNAVYSGDTGDNGASSPCEPITVAKASPGIGSLLSATTITVGGSTSDSATLSGAFNAGGTVTYEYFTGTVCAGTPTPVGTPVTSTNGLVPNSQPQSFSAAGAYSWNAIYSGDPNNNGATSPCEPMTVSKASPTLTTALSASSIVVGMTGVDSANLNSGFQASGTVTYLVFTNGLCSSPGAFVSLVTVNNNAVPNSKAVTFNSTGPYSFDASYSGDANNNGAASSCEPLTVIRATPTITTTISPASTIIVGNTVADQATLSGGAGAITGTVTYEFYGLGVSDCSGSPVKQQSVNVGSPLPASNPQTITVAGQYSFDATYSGDATNNPATSPCEPLTALRASPTIATSLSSTTINVGTTATDSATLTNSFNAAGTVTYDVFTNSACTSPFSTVSIVQVTNGVFSNSRPVMFNATGSYGFQAVYSGDANNNGIVSACEPLAVQKVSPILSTSLSTSSIIVGNTAVDSSVLSGGFQSSGTATYTTYGNQACTAPGNVAATVTVVGGIIPDSRAIVFNATGSYSFKATYSGDASNNAATSTCEPLMVAKANPIVTTSLSLTSITIGQSVTDSASLTNGFQSSGSVSYYFFSTSGNCLTTATLVKTVTIGADGSVPNSGPFAPPGTGSVSFDALYSGDASNNQFTSTCESLTVNKAGPTITANLSTTTITVGQSLTNSASLTGGFPSSGVQGIVTYNYFSSTLTCTGSPSILTTVIVGTSDSVPSSGLFTPPNAGIFSFNVVYGGDANNNPATSGCEPLTVGRASPTIATVLSPSSIVVGNTATDSSTLAGAFGAGGTVTYSAFGDSICTAPGTVVSIVIITSGVVPSSRSVTFNATGNYAFLASYSGDSNNNPAAGSCEPLAVAKANPTISTLLSVTTITVGGSSSDSATLRGGYQAGGTVTYRYFLGSSCGGTAAVVGSPVTVTNGEVPDSVAQAFTSASSYSWNAVYSGDSNNNAATSPCEPLTVNKASPSLSTSLSSTSIQVGQSVTDSATLNNAFQASGSVKYSVFGNGACTPLGNVASIVSVSNGQVPNSRSVLFNATGSFSFSASYSGDTNNNGAVSSCESLPVNPVGVAITTTLSATTISVGGSTSDSAALLGETSSAGGTVVYNYFANGSCAAPATIVGSPAIVTNGVIPNSPIHSFNTAGTYSWNAIYSGDSNNNGATSGCEPLLVIKASPTLTTTLSASSLIVGTSATDSSTLLGGFGATGTVSYSMFTNGACLSSGTLTDSVTLNGGTVPSSRAVMFNVTGGYSFQAAYSGDTNNNGVTSACETLAVTKASPLISTSLSASTIVVAGSIHDSATITGGFQPGGSVSYEYFSGSGACTGTPTVVGPPASITGGAVSDSLTQTFNSAGQFSWNALYTGDINNNGAVSQCEPLAVNKITPVIATSLSATTIIVGGSAVDSATLSGGYNPSGTVTYEFFSGSTCTGIATSIGASVSVTSGVVPNSASQSFSSAGSFGWNAVYSGDSNNNGATSPCEPMTVGKASPNISTTLSSNTIVVGTTATDSASLANSFDASGTVTYTLFATSVCSGQATTLPNVMVTGGLVPNSPTIILNSTGSFGLHAVYSGDQNNNGATSNCEALTVQKTSPTIRTTLSATAITVGSSGSDSASLTGDFQAGGTVTYSLFTNSACQAPGTVFTTVTVFNGLVPKSRSIVFNVTGSYGFEAAYSGDANNNFATGNCDSLQVNPKGVLISTSLSQTVTTVGGSVSDSATMSGQTSSAGGTVTYNIFANSGCASPGIIVSIVAVSNGIIPNSRTVVLNFTLSYSFNAAYSGDTNNNGATSGCETLTVGKASPTITTTSSTTTQLVGRAVVDSAALSDSFNAGGTVTYTLFTNGGCTSLGTVVSMVAVSNGAVPGSRAVTFNSTGSFSFQAIYSGDTNNNGATSPCEPLTVQKSSPTTATTLSATAIIVGNTVTDSSTLTSSFGAGGTVTYSDFTNGGCTAPGSVVSTVTVTSGVVPNSRSVTFNSTGSFSFQAVYSGDANNNGATSPCELVTVNKANPTIATTLSATTIIVGNSVSGSSTLSNFYKGSGTVTYEFFTGSACTGTATSVGTPVTVTDGVAPNSGSQTFGSTGLFSWNAIYSGDANNSGATSTCKPLTVNKASPALTATLSFTSITSGDSVTASATLTGGFQEGGTATYEFFTTSTCTGTPSIVGSLVTVLNGIIPRSSSHTFATAGVYRWNAVYSGDSNNSPATSQCLVLTVLSPPALTVPGTQTITAGSMIRFLVNATDGSKTVTLTASGLPPGATFSSTQSFTGGTSSLFQWTPSDTQAPGNYNVTFTAVAESVSTSSEVTIHVVAPVKAAPLPIVSYSIIGLVGFIAVISVAFLLRRFQNPRRRSNS